MHRPPCSMERNPIVPPIAKPRIELAPIEDRRKRKNTYKKRSMGLVKKCQELHNMCTADICVFSLNNGEFDPFEWCNCEGGVSTLLRRYLELSPEQENKKKNLNPVSQMEHQIKRTNQELDNMTKNNYNLKKQLDERKLTHIFDTLQAIQIKEEMVLQKISELTGEPKEETYRYEEYIADLFLQAVNSADKQECHKSNGALHHQPWMVPSDVQGISELQQPDFPSFLAHHHGQEPCGPSASMQSTRDPFFLAQPSIEGNYSSIAQYPFYLGEIGHGCEKDLYNGQQTNTLIDSNNHTRFIDEGRARGYQGGFQNKQILQGAEYASVSSQRHHIVHQNGYSSNNYVNNNFCPSPVGRFVTQGYPQPSDHHGQSNNSMKSMGEVPHSAKQATLGQGDYQYWPQNGYGSNNYVSNKNNHVFFPGCAQLAQAEDYQSKVPNNHKPWQNNLIDKISGLGFHHDVGEVARGYNQSERQDTPPYFHHVAINPQAVQDQFEPHYRDNIIPQAYALTSVEDSTMQIVLENITSNENGLQPMIEEMSTSHDSQPDALASFHPNGTLERPHDESGMFQTFGSGYHYAYPRNQQFNRWSPISSVQNVHGPQQHQRQQYSNEQQSWQESMERDS